jgi:glutaredoxin
VAVYGSSCPACTQAKAVLDRFHVAHVDHPMSALPRRYGPVRSMPQITINGELLGGVNQLLRLARAGGLERIANDDPTPWVRIKRRLGRGYDVVMLDTLGHELLSRRAATQAESARIADELVATPTVHQDGSSA